MFISSFHLRALGGAWPRRANGVLVLLCLLPLAGLHAQAQTMASSAPGFPKNAAAQIEGALTVVTGQVLGPDGLPLSGATAQVEGSRELVVTNSEGEFLLKARFGQGPVFVTCRYAGYNDQRLSLGTSPAGMMRVEMVKTVHVPLPVTGQRRDL